MRKEFSFCCLPLVALLATGCRTTVPDIADYLTTKCQGNSALEVARQQIELAPGQRIQIDEQYFELTDKGRLRYQNANQIEIGADDAVITSYGERYLVRNLPSEGDRFTIDVSLNCKDRQADPK
jgi:hypothetical protein